MKSPLFYAWLSIGLEILCAFILEPIFNAHIFDILALSFGVLFFGFMFIGIRNDWRILYR